MLMLFKTNIAILLLIYSKSAFKPTDKSAQFSFIALVEINPFEFSHDFSQFSATKVGRYLRRNQIFIPFSEKIHQIKGKLSFTLMSWVPQTSLVEFHSINAVALIKKACKKVQICSNMVETCYKSQNMLETVKKKSCQKMVKKSKEKLKNSKNVIRWWEGRKMLMSCEKFQKCCRSRNMLGNVENGKT